MTDATLRTMALGGIHDHIGGGFHRYATDSDWFTPHFEKMLYDNAQLLRAYVDAWRLQREPLFLYTAVSLADWVLRDMTHPDGGFYSALDADSEGEEGKFYIWTSAEMVDVLGKKDAQRFMDVYQATAQGNFRDEATGRLTGANILHLDAVPEGFFNDDALRKMRGKLLARREQRVPPGLDDKVLTAWNALMIDAMAHAGRYLEKPEYLTAAEKAAAFIMKNMRSPQGRLLRTYRKKAKLNAYLDDIAFLADALLTLHAATGDEKWRNHADELARQLIDHYADWEQGGFHFTSDDHEELIARPMDPFDNVTPSGNAVAARVLIELYRQTGNADYKTQAQRTLRLFGTILERHAQSMPGFLRVLRLYHRADQPMNSKPVQVRAEPYRLRGAPGDTVETTALLVIQPGWHITATEPGADYLIPLQVRLAPDPSVQSMEPLFPESSMMKGVKTAAKINIYSGEIRIPIKLRLKEKAEIGLKAINLEICTQACSDTSCLAPQIHKLVLELNVEK